ncbi:autotransporter outer membrane beta-barrel domain-containing protein [Bradyrhizobium sp. 62]|uniref:autotransporter family protein n=1 Tax=Bradyrhizobium sp. 62 TaxID=1043588 RepID=UPI001FF7E66C|nr:autotransporter outer membrane beta-barrel domain-containing protein [Bradyrhizobium sp. 62]MCK1366404.1 autotransporter outer membrane beta-barrel domain-containing protein [Bradyrhizobium sp. 62]
MIIIGSAAAIGALLQALTYRSAVAQQVVADGTTQSASGTINTGVLTPTGGYGLYALNNGIINGFSPLSVITGGAGSDAAHAQSGGIITLFSGSSVSTAGSSAAGLLATGINSVLNTTDTTVFTMGSNARGVEATQSGTVNFTGGSVTTTGSMAYALSAPQANSTITASAVTINTTGGAAYGARANGSGHIVLNGGSIATAGSGADALITIDSAASIDVTNTIIRTSGPTASGANGFFGRMTLDHIAVTTFGDNSHGARADNLGSVTVTGGAFTTVGTSSFGLLSTLGSTLIATNATVVTSGASGIGASAQFGGRLVLNGGTITTGGTAAAGLFSVGLLSALSATPAVPSLLVLLDDALSPSAGATGSSITANGVTVRTSGSGSHGASIRGGSSLAMNDSSIAVSGAGASALFSSAYDIGSSTALINNSTLIAAQGAGVRASGTALNATFVGSSITGSPNLLEVVGNGTLNLVSGSSILTGAAMTEAGSTSNVTLQNNSTWNVTGNSNVTNLANDPSLIQFTRPTGDPTVLTSYKTLTAANYIGQGGTMGLNTYLGTDGSPSDRLVINGGTASGNSLLRITNAAGAGALTTGNGILVVDTINAGTTAPGTFALVGRVAAGPYEYILFRSSVDASNAQAWYLRSTLDCSLSPNDPVCPAPGPGAGPAPPDFRPETSLYAAIPSMALLYGGTLLDTFHERVGDEGQSRNQPRLNGVAAGAWGRVIGQHGNHEGDPLGVFGSGPKFDYNIGAFQGGQDLLRRDGADGSRDHAGLYAAVGLLTGDVTHFDRTFAGANSINAYSLGGYWTHFGATGWYLDAILQGTWYNVRSASTSLPALTTNGWGFASSLEAGYPVHLGGGFVIEPQAQIVYQTISLGDGSDTAATVQFRNAGSVAARIGARITRTSSLSESASITTWIRPSLWNEFRGDPQTLFSSAAGPIAFRSDLGGSWFELTAGADSKITASTSLFASAGSQVGSTRAYNGRGGLRVAW